MTHIRREYKGAIVLSVSAPNNHLNTCSMTNIIFLAKLQFFDFAFRFCKMLLCQKHHHGLVFVLKPTPKDHEMFLSSSSTLLAALLFIFFLPMRSRDAWLPWFQMFSDRSDCLAWHVASRLHVRAGMPRAVGNARVHTRQRGRVDVVPSVPERPYTASMCARVQTSVCQNKTAAAS